MVTESRFFPKAIEEDAVIYKCEGISNMLVKNLSAALIHAKDMNTMSSF